MHQQARHPPRMSSPATSPQTNPTRTNNPRETLGAIARTRSGSEVAEREGGATLEPQTESSGAGGGPTRDSIKKLDQIVQNFYLKAAVLILQSRMTVTPSGDNRKTNKWFQIETDDIDDFRDELRIWKTSGSFENRPPPMIIETYLDASSLSSSQSLVIIDENGKRWDALEALNSSEYSGEGSPDRLERRNTEIILERWRIELRCLGNDDMDDFGPSLPTIYKRSIVFFRSLFVTTRVMPGWKYAQQAAVKSVHPALKIKCRFRTAEPEFQNYDPLRLPLFDGRDVVTEYMFGDLEVPVGRFYASVTYRNDCNFRVDDSESLLSSRFVDEDYFKPSIPTRRELKRNDSFTEVGSLPSHRRGRGAQEPQQTYGSLSTFHGAGALGTSPITALKAVRPAGSDTSSPTGSVPASVEPEPPHSLPIRPASRPTLRNFDGSTRRPSVSLQPFKAGSLSGSPRVTDADVPASPHSLSRPGLGGISQQAARNRSSLTAGMPASLRGGPLATAITTSETPPIVGSPKPGKYGSSFTHRKGRSSISGPSRPGDDDQVSSGKQSLSSSAQPGSGLLTEAGGAGSSGSLQTDDDNISDFLKALDSRKTLRSFEPTKKGESSSAAIKTIAQLSKYQLMKESNNALTESMTSSMQLHRSSSTSSRQLSNVPGMVNPASMSISSSPGKPLSPHTPHTPAIPSRLSENSIIDYPQGRATVRQTRNPDIIATEEESSENPPPTQDGTTAIPIPMSPRLLHADIGGARRASSVAQQNRALAGEDDSDIVQRSISLGADEREAPTLSTLLGLQRASGTHSSASPAGLQPAADIRASSSSNPSSPSAERDEKGSSPGGFLAGTPYRMRYQGRTRGGTPPTSSRGSFSGGRYAGSIGRGTVGEEGDDEPLVFAMSELERDTVRRSLEEGRGGTPLGSGGLGTLAELGGKSSSSGGGGSGSGSETADKFEPRGITRRGWS